MSKKHEKYILPVAGALCVGIIVFYLRANLEQGLETNKHLIKLHSEISAMAPVVTRSVLDLQQHKIQLSILSKASVTQCLKIKQLFPDTSPC